MSDQKAKTEAQADRVADDVAALKQDVAALIRQMAEYAKREAGRLGQTAADSVADRASGIYDTVSEKSRRSADVVSAHVEDQPIKSLLIAFAAGFVISKILTR